MLNLDIYSDYKKSPIVDIFCNYLSKYNNKKIFTFKPIKVNDNINILYKKAETTIDLKYKLHCNIIKEKVLMQNQNNINQKLIYFEYNRLTETTNSIYCCFDNEIDYLNLFSLFLKKLGFLDLTLILRSVEKKEKEEIYFALTNVFNEYPHYFI